LMPLATNQIKLEVIGQALPEEGWWTLESSLLILSLAITKDLSSTHIFKEGWLTSGWQLLSSERMQCRGQNHQGFVTLLHGPHFNWTYPETLLLTAFLLYPITLRTPLNFLACLPFAPSLLHVPLSLTHHLSSGRELKGHVELMISKSMTYLCPGRRIISQMLTLSMILFFLSPKWNLKHG
jgi:hypothetical protein